MYNKSDEINWMNLNTFMPNDHRIIGYFVKKKLGIVLCNKNDKNPFLNFHFLPDSYSRVTNRRKNHRSPTNRGRERILHKIQPEILPTLHYRILLRFILELRTWRKVFKIQLPRKRNCRSPFDPISKTWHQTPSIPILLRRSLQRREREGCQEGSEHPNSRWGKREEKKERQER